MCLPQDIAVFGNLIGSLPKGYKQHDVPSIPYQYLTLKALLEIVLYVYT